MRECVAIRGGKMMGDEENWASSVAFVSTLVMLGVEISTVKLVA